jgi:hypothetical protein
MLVCCAPKSTCLIPHRAAVLITQSLIRLGLILPPLCSTSASTCSSWAPKNTRTRPPTRSSSPATAVRGRNRTAIGWHPVANARRSAGTLSLLSKMPPDARIPGMFSQRRAELPFPCLDLGGRFEQRLRVPASHAVCDGVGRVEQRVHGHGGHGLLLRCGPQAPLGRARQVCD